MATNKPIVEMDGKSILRSRTNNPQDLLATLLDKSWVQRSFMVSNGNMNDSVDKVNRFTSTADFKITDTRIGRNIGINPRPQFTRYSDIRRKGRMSSRNKVTTTSTSGNYGLGRYYSEAIDDPSQTIYFRFGVPEYTTLLDFLSRAFDPDALHLAKTGRSKNLLFNIGEVIGGFVGIVAFPQVAAVMYIGKIANVLYSKPRYKFYTLKPAMHNYWSAVNNLVNTIAVNLKLMPTIIADDKTQLIGKPFVIDKEVSRLMHELLPDVFSEDNYIDMYAVANQAQVAANKIFIDEYDRIDNNSKYDAPGYLKGNKQIKNYYLTDSIFKIDEGIGRTLSSFVNKHTMMSDWFKDDGLEASKNKAEISPTIDPGTGEFDKAKAENPSSKTTYTQYLDSEFRSGSQFAIFKVNYTSAPQESFTNSVKESELSQQINSTVSQASDARFSLGQFKLPGAIGDVLNKLVGGVGDVLAGAASTVTFGTSDAITSILSGSYIDIPKHWQSSDVNLAKANYNMTLISPYGNPLSMLQNIYMPLCMLLAGGLPLAGGKNSYTSPFICELYDRGKVQIRLGMIESITVTRGTSNLGFTVNNKPLAIDVSVSVVDLSSIMSIPISAAGFMDAVVATLGAPAAAVGGALGVYNPAIDEDSLLYDYLAVLTGLDIYSQTYAVPKAKMNLAKSLIQSRALSSPAAWAMLTNDVVTSSVLKYSPIGWYSNLIDGVVPPSSIDDPARN